MIFDPACPQDVVVETEEECVDSCVSGDDIWAPIDREHDACAATYIPYVECMSMLTCEEFEPHFRAVDQLPTNELACGDLLRPQLDCQTAHH